MKAEDRTHQALKAANWNGSGGEVLFSRVTEAIRQAEAAARAEEREACAAMLEKRAYYFEGPIPVRLVESPTGEPALHICAKAIRARD